MVDIQRVLVAVAIAALINVVPRFLLPMIGRRIGEEGPLPTKEERPPLTQEDLLSALREERQLAKRVARAELILNIVLTIFSLVAGWLLSGLVHLPGQH